jgi:flagellar protein FliO/FliZ
VLVILAGSTVALAANESFAAPTQQLIGATTSSALRVPLALILVIGMVLCAAWFMRRMNGQTHKTAQRLQIIAQVQLGAREKAILLRVADQDVLLGVAPGSVRLLLTTAAPPPGTDAAASAPATDAPSLKDSFKEVLRRSLGR